MTVSRYPGNLRVGVMHLPVTQVQDPGEQAVEPKQLLLVLLNGRQRFRVGPHEFVFCADHQPQALMIRIERQTTMEYLENTGAPLSKIAVATDTDWLEFAQSGELSAPVPGLSGHLSSRQWVPDAAMLAVATELIASANQRGRAQDDLRLYRMSRGIDLLRAAIAACSDQPASDTAPAGIEAEHPRIAQLRREVADHLSDPDFGPDQLARACGLGLRSLQRLCREALGCSPGDFIRHQRFEAAFSALRRGAVNVSQAAFMAGYTNSANFSTAFKREYGIAPKFVRQDHTPARRAP